MDKFFDFLEPDLPITTIRELLKYIRSFVAAFHADIPVEGSLGKINFCASEQPGEAVQIHWVQVNNQQRIPINATV